MDISLMIILGIGLLILFKVIKLLKKMVFRVIGLVFSLIYIIRFITLLS